MMAAQHDTREYRESNNIAPPLSPCDAGDGGRYWYSATDPSRVKGLLLLDRTLPDQIIRPFAPALTAARNAGALTLDALE